MIRISSDKVTRGMVLARNIINSNGRALLTKNQHLTQRYIKRLRELKIPYVYIDDGLGLEDTTPPVKPSTVTKATKSLKQAFDYFVETGKADLQAIESQIDNIIDELSSNKNILFGMSELKTYDDYTYQHSVNVCILSIVIGMKQGYSRQQLRELGFGAMLHDIGKTKIPPEILNKPTLLTYEEYIEIKKHPWEGFSIVQSFKQLPYNSVYAILQHHEQVDGRGYPRGLNKYNIHDYGLIVAVADVFDALISDRPYRPAYTNLEAMEIILQDRDTKLSGKYIDALFAHINIYPPGTMVHLSNGDLAVIVKNNADGLNHPQLKLLFNSDMEPYDMDTSLDLSIEKNVYIKKVLSHQETEQHILEFFKHT